MNPDHLDAETLFRRHAGFVAGFVARMGVPHVDVEDVVQEVFLVAHRRGGYVAGAAKVTTWLAEIAVRVISTRRRTQRRRPETPDLEAIGRQLSDGVQPIDAAEAREMLARVQRALASLDLDRRALFVLFEIEGESCSDIATAMGVPLTTIYSRLHTARVAFLAAYDRLTTQPARRAAPLSLRPLPAGGRT